MKNIITVLACITILFLTFCSCNSRSATVKEINDSFMIDKSKEERTITPENSEKDTSHSFHYFTKPKNEVNYKKTNDSTIVIMGGKFVTRSSTTACLTSDPIKTSYIPDFKNPENISKERELKIKTDYLKSIKKTSQNSKIDIDNIKLDQYLGTYNGCEVILISCSLYPHTDKIYTDVIGEYKFNFYENYPVLIYKESEFIQLKEAYEKKIISKKDMKNIKYYYDNMKLLREQQ